MNNIFHQGALALMAAAAMALGACTSEYEYDPYANVDNAGVYISEPATEATQIIAGPTASVTITLKRAEAASEQTVTLAADNDGLAMPASVTFAAGETAKDIAIPVTLAPGIYDVAITLSGDTKTFNYGPHTYQQQLVVTNDEPVAGTYTSNDMFGGGWPVEVYLAGTDGGIIKDCFEEGKDIIFSVDADNFVTVLQQDAFTHSSYGTVWVQDYEGRNGLAPGDDGFLGYSRYYPSAQLYCLALTYWCSAGIFDTVFDYLQLGASEGE